MPSYEAMRDGLAARISGLPNIGVVHDRERLILDWSKYLAQFTSVLEGEHQRRVRGWWITREAVDGENFAFAGDVRRTHRFVVRGILGVADADDTELEHQQLIQDVMDALDASATLGGLALTVGPTSARTIEPRQFGSVLCHYTEIACPVQTVDDLALVA
jgi:hypothetical protein